MMSREKGRGGTAAVKVRVNEPELVPSLLEFLRARVHVTAEQIGIDEVEISQLGSMNADARRLELDLLLAAWRAAHDQARTTILD
jgi:hypothetical protein